MTKRYAYSFITKKHYILFGGAGWYVKEQNCDYPIQWFNDLIKAFEYIDQYE